MYSILTKTAIVLFLACICVHGMCGCTYVCLHVCRHIYTEGGGLRLTLGVFADNFVC